MFLDISAIDRIWLLGEEKVSWFIFKKNSFKTREVQLDDSWSNESVCVNVVLSPHIMFNILVVYNPPSSCLQTFYKNLEKILHSFKLRSELLIYGDINFNWLDKSSMRPLKELTSKYDYHQFINGSSLLT